MQLEIRGGYSLLELIAVLALIGIFFYAFAGISFSSNKDDLWLRMTLDSLTEHGMSQVHRIGSPYRIQFVSEDVVVLKLQRQVDEAWEDVKAVRCPTGVSLELDNCQGYDMTDSGIAFPITLSGLKEGGKVVFNVSRKTYSYIF